MARKKRGKSSPPRTKRAPRQALGKQGLDALSPFRVRRDGPDPIDAMLAKRPKRKTPRPPPLTVERPRQGRLFTQRAATTAALGTRPSKRAGDRDATERALREAICEEYRRDRAQRREVMFAKGSAGKGRRNTSAPKQRDWRAEFCS